MNQKEIDNWFCKKWGEDLEFYEKSLGNLYKMKEKAQEDGEILDLINRNISITFGEILWLRKKLQI